MISEHGSMAPRPPANHHAPLAIGRDTYLIRSMFGEGEGPVAVYVNSMVITGPEPIVVDTGTVANREQWLADVFSLVEPTDIRYVFLSHDDHDHVGNLVEVLERAPRATVVTTWFSLERLAGDFRLPLDRVRWIYDGESFDAGDRTLVAVRPPVFDSPTTRGLYDPTTGVYWASDCFASLLPGPITDAADTPEPMWEETFLQLNRLVSAWHTLVDPAKYDAVVGAVERLGASTVISGHAPALTGERLARSYELLRQLPHLAAAVEPTQSDLDAMVAQLAAAAA